MTCRQFEQIDKTLGMMRQLERSPLGTIAILGNHDYAIGWSRTKVADRLARGLGELGIRVLRNKLIVMDGLKVVGLDDLWSPRFGPQMIMPMVDHDQPSPVLCHNPDAADQPIWAGYRGWILCGHTHGGQCEPPLFRPSRLNMLNTRYAAGEIDLSDRRWMYINRGLGYLHRIRFNVRPEITAFTLSRAVV